MAVGVPNANFNVALPEAVEHGIGYFEKAFVVANCEINLIFCLVKHYESEGCLPLPSNQELVVLDGEREVFGSHAECGGEPLFNWRLFYFENLWVIDSSEPHENSDVVFAGFIQVALDGKVALSVREFLGEIKLFGLGPFIQEENSNWIFIILHLAEFPVFFAIPCHLSLFSIPLYPECLAHHEYRRQLMVQHHIIQILPRVLYVRLDVFRVREQLEGGNAASSQHRNHQEPQK